MCRGFYLRHRGSGRPGDTEGLILFSPTLSAVFVFRLGNDQRAFRRRRSLDQTAAADHLGAPFRYESERQRIDPMLGLEHAGSERFGRVVVVDRHRGLRNDRTGVGLRYDEVNGRARYLHPRLERLAVWIEARKRRQKSRVDVEHAALPMQYEVRRQQPQETAETNELHAMRVEYGLQRTLKGGAIVPVRAMVDHGSGNCVYLGACEPGRFRSVGD